MEKKTENQTEPATTSWFIGTRGFEAFRMITIFAGA